MDEPCPCGNHPIGQCPGCANEAAGRCRWCGHQAPDPGTGRCGACDADGDLATELGTFTGVSAVHRARTELETL